MIAEGKIVQPVTRRPLGSNLSFDRIYEMSINNSIAYRLSVDWTKELPSSNLLHKYGGTPSNGIGLPKCGSCKKYYHLLFQIDLRDQSLNYLDLQDQEFLYVISCMNCATYERPYFYLLSDHKEIKILHESPRKYVHEYPVPLEEFQVSCKRLQNDEYPISEDGFYYKLPNQRGNHQLGGKPLWIQDEEHIQCIRCKKEMSYLAMIDTDLHIGKDGLRERGHMFGDNGILYLFFCSSCRIFSGKAQGL
jgi:predicted nucleic-acid-binding Zn-ribbon protein